MADFAIVSSKDIHTCMSAARFTGHCHTRCTRVDRCKLPEGGKARIAIAEHTLEVMRKALKEQEKKVNRLKTELQGLET